MRETSFGKVDALAQNGELHIPLVILKNESQNSTFPYLGFIPGFLMKNINGTTIEECKTKLKEYLIQKLKIMKQNNEPFPFFPTKEEIMKEYSNVEVVEFIKITTSKNQ